jgi:hypothetical protein
MALSELAQKILDHLRDEYEEDPSCHEGGLTTDVDDLKEEYGQGALKALDELWKEQLISLEEKTIYVLGAVITVSWEEEKRLTADEAQELWDAMIDGASSYRQIDCFFPIDPEVEQKMTEVFAQITGWTPVANGSDSGCDEWRMK